MKFSNRTSTSRDYNNYVKRLRQLSSNPVSKVSGVVSLTIFTVAFFGVFAILPTLKTIASLSREIEDIEGVNQKLSLKIKSLSQAEEVYAQVVDDLVLIDKVLPEEPEFNRLAWQIEQLVLSSGVEISSANFGGFQVVGVEVVEDGVGKISSDVAVVGSYSQVKQFIKKLGTIDRLITVDDVRISSKSLKQKGGVSVNIQFGAYYLPPTDNVVKTDKKL